MQERQTERYHAAIGIVLSDNQNTETCLTRYVSSSGLFALTKKQWPLGAALSVQVVHQGERFSFGATVAHRDASGVGLGFVDVPPGSSQKLSVVLQQLVPHDEGRVQAKELVVHWAPRQRSRGMLAAWKRRQRKARLIDITVEGAGIKSKDRPAVGEQIDFFLPPMDATEPAQVSTQASVVRHMDSGFAVRFESPERAFRQAVSCLRRQLRG